MLETALHTRGLLHDSSFWQLLEGGRTNWLWRVTQPDGDIVVKLYSGETRNPLFPNDPQSEADVLRHLEGQNIAPRLQEHFQTDAGICLTYTHLDGVPWTSGCTQVASLLHRLHKIKPPVGLRQVPDGSAALRQQGMTILEECPRYLTQQLRQLEPKGCVAPSGASCLLHADPVPTNMIAQAGKLKLIDWQCPAIGDPCEDLAVFLSPAMQITYRGNALSATERATFLDAYPGKATIRRYRLLEPWYHWRMAAYCLWKETQGDEDAAHAYEAEVDAMLATASEQI